MYNVVTVEINKELSKERLDSLIHFAVNECRCLGIEEFSLEEKQVDELLGERAYSGGDLPLAVLDEVDMENETNEFRKLKFFFDGQENLIKEFLNQLSQMQLAFETEGFQESDWDLEWKKTYEPVEIDPGLWIVPEWMKSGFDVEKSVFINPGQGFGTGKHETTFMCLQLMRLISLDKIKRVLDFGCGSGILGVAVLRFSNPEVCFCDIDKNALNNTLQNLTLNFSDRDLSNCSLVLRERMHSSSEHYDLIFANILLSALKEEHEIIKSSLKENGYLIASGLLNYQVEEFVDAYREFEVSKVATMNDWSAVLLRKKG